MAMEFLYEGLLAITWQQAVMYAVGGLLIWLAIEKGYEPALLLPMGCGAEGVVQWLFEVGIESSEAFPLLLFIGIGAMIDCGPLLANPRLFLFGAAAQVGIFLTVIAATLMGFDIREAASMGRIGAAGGSTRVLVSQAV